MYGIGKEIGALLRQRERENKSLEEDEGGVGTNVNNCKRHQKEPIGMWEVWQHQKNEQTKKKTQTNKQKTCHFQPLSFLPLSFLPLSFSKKLLFYPVIPKTEVHCSQNTQKQNKTMIIR